jgi:SPP1 gp7 family putative phage head morphogenesis protein
MDRERNAINRIVATELIANATIQLHNEILSTSLAEIENQIKALFQGGVDSQKLNIKLSPAEQRRFLSSISSSAGRLGVDPRTIIPDGDFVARLSRLEAMREQIYWLITADTPDLERVFRSGAVDILKESYRLTSLDINNSRGLVSTFAILDDRALTEILSAEWLGANYSQRIWVNTQRLATRLPAILGKGMVTGMSQERIMRVLGEEFQVQRYELSRLVRTELNRFNNRAELQSYKDEGIEYYEYFAYLDNRTSKVCTNLNGRIFRVEDAKEGVNYPPLHPNCRSTTKLVFSDEDKAKEAQVRGKDYVFNNDEVEFLD